jgi:hypothetical protein
MAWDTGSMIRPRVNPFDRQQQQQIQQLSGAVGGGRASTPGYAPQPNYAPQSALSTATTPTSTPNPSFGSGITMPQASPSSTAITNFANLAPGTTSPGAGGDLSGPRMPILTAPPTVAQPGPTQYPGTANGTIGTSGWWDQIAAMQNRGGDPALANAVAAMGTPTPPPSLAANPTPQFPAWDGVPGHPGDPWIAGGR